MKLLVDHTRATAERVIRILGLDPLQWQPCGLREELGGQQFDQIVVVNMLETSTFERQWLTEDLPLKLPPGKKIEFL